ncbi:MAG: efflux RND transporter periplasmic adaptor subunit [Saprospiraceae bacterium]
MKYLRLILIIVLIGAGAGIYFQLQKNKALIEEKASQTETVITAIPVKTVAVTKEKLNPNLKLVGTFEARKELTVIAESQGLITNILVEEGQNISKGQILAHIDDATIQSRLTSAKAALEKSQKDVERYKNLLDVGAISQTQYEEVKLGMQNQETNLITLQQQLKYTKAKAPMNGVVSEVMLEEGSFVNPGSAIASIVDINKLKLVVKLDEKDIVKVKKGQKVQVSTEVYPDYQFSGVINQIDVQANAARKYEVAIEMDNSKEHPLKAGMYGVVEIPSQVKSEETVLTIPRKSIVGSIKNPQVYVAGNNQALLKDIEIGELLEDRVVVKSGLQEGEEIIVTGQINLENGRAITITSSAKSISESSK